MQNIQYYFNEKKNFPISTGVYLITFKNSESGKIYVGSAAQCKSLRPSENGFRTRWTNHLSDLKLQKHDSKKLQFAYNKYGSENIIFEVIEYCSPETCLDREQFYIDFYNSYNYGYNSRPKAENQLGFRHSQITKDKIKQSKKEKRDILSEQIVNLYKENKTTREIGEIVNLNHHTVGKILNESGVFDKLRTRADYIKINKKLKARESFLKSMTPERKRKMRERNMGNQHRGRIKNIKQLDLQENLIKIWTDSKEIVIFYGLKNATPILRVLSGERKHFKGFKWSI